MKIHLTSHGAIVTDIATSQEKWVVNKMLHTLVETKLERNRDGSFSKKNLRTYAARTKDWSQVRFHRNMANKFIGFAKSNITTPIEIIDDDVDEYPYEVCRFSVTGLHKPRPEQEEVLNGPLAADMPRSKLANIQTGRGKTFLACANIADHRLRTAIIARAGFLEQWEENLLKFFTFEPGGLLYIDSGSMLRRVLTSKQEIVFDVALISNTLLRNYIAEWESSSGKSPITPVPPEEIFRKLKIGFRVIDEGHMDFHFNFKLDLYTKCRRSLTLSATFDSSDQFTNEMYEIAYPKRERITLPYVKYIDAFAVHYRIKEHQKIRWRGAQGYNHNTFEASLRQHKKILHSYLDMVGDIIQSRFVGRYAEGKKALVFFSSIWLCDYAASYYAKRFENFAVGSYCDGRDKSILVESDIIVSTDRSAGTAIDIPGLFVNILTIAINSRQLNEQILGRTRELLMFPGEYPEFYFLICDDISKHVEYGMNKFQYFADKARSITNYPKSITI